MDKTRGDDAQDHAPQPKERKSETPSGKPDASSYEEQNSDSASIAVENLNSADDEGAN